MATNFVLQAKQKPCAIFAIFTPYESVLGADDRSEFFVQYLKGHCHGNQFSGKMGQNYLPPCTYRSVIPKSNGYRYLNVRTNSVNDASISCENFVKFDPVTSELSGLICERQVRHSQKNVSFSRISPDILDRFLQSFHLMKALYMQMMDLYLIFQFFRRHCHSNQILLQKCYQRRLIPVAPLLENELQNHGLAVRINSGDDGATSSKNLVNF